METLVINAGRRPAAPEAIERLGAILAGGGIVAFPTETVYGLGVALDRPDAVSRLLALKGSPPERPLTIQLADRSGLSSRAAPLSRSVERLVSRLWPGPLTVVVPDRDGGRTGFRLPAHREARDLVRAAGVTIVATSANAAGKPPLLTGRGVLEAYEGRVDGILARGRSELGVPSTVVEVGPEGLTVHREGALPLARVREALAFSILFVCTGNLCRSPMAEAILRARLAASLGVPESELTEQGFLIHSAGTAAVAGTPATPAARRAASRYDGNLLDHRARPLSMDLLEGADLVYVAEARHAQTIRDFVPEIASRVFPLGPDGSDLPDPYGGTDAEYRESAAMIFEATSSILARVLAESN